MTLTIYTYIESVFIIIISSLYRTVFSNFLIIGGKKLFSAVTFLVYFWRSSIFTFAV